MKTPSYAIFAGKTAVVAVAGLGALALSAAAGMYVVVLCGGSVQGIAAMGVFLGAAVAVLVCVSIGLRKLPWSWRAGVGVLLLASSFMLLPRSTCAAERQSHVEC